MGTWAKETAEHLRNEDIARQVESERFLEEQRLRRALGPGLWRCIRELLKQNCEELNQELRKGILFFEVQPSTEVIIRRLDKPATLHVGFDENSSRLKYSCGAGKGGILNSYSPGFNGHF